MDYWTGILDWTTGLEYWTELFSFLDKFLCLLNQVRAWFLRIASVRELLYACLCVCPPPRLSITSGVMWCDIDSI